MVVAAGGAGVGDDGGDPAADPRVIADPDGFGVVVEQAERVGMQSCPQLLVGGAEATKRVVLEFGELAVALEELAEPASRLAGFAGDRLGHGRSHGRSLCAYA